MGPNSHEKHPELALRPAAFGPARLPFEHQELMAQRQNFQGEIVPPSKERKRIRQNDPKHGQHDPLSLKANSLHSTIS